MRIDKIPDDAVLIAGTLDDYVDPRGKIYGYNHRYRQPVYPYMKEQQAVYGYMYAPINYITGRRNKRVHRIVAETFIPNPQNLPIVMHKDNNKSNNCVDNLKWGTLAENTQQAFADGLACNAKGFEDSQSIPCDMYETATNVFIQSFGSCKEASRYTGINAATIARQIQYPELPVRKKFYFTQYGSGPRDHEIVVVLDMNTDKIVWQCANCQMAALVAGVDLNTVTTQIRLGKKPRWSKSGFYFRRMYLKCEEVIEI